MVIDKDDHTGGLGRFWLGRFFFMLTPSGFLEELTQPRNFLQAKIMGVWPLEKSALVSDAEHKLIASMRLHFTQVLNQFDGLTPTQVMG